MSDHSLYETYLNVKDSKHLEDDKRFRVLIAGAKAALSQNACFKSDLRLAIEWLTEAKSILDSRPDGIARISV